MTQALKLGKTPARAGAVRFALTDYLPDLPIPPAVFGHQDLVTEWGMLGNDRWGNCVWAGAAHETMLWTREGAAVDAAFTDADVTGDYAAATGFNPADPSTDRGTDMGQAASYRRRTGILDVAGKRHKVLAYVSLRTSLITVASWLFGGIGVGIEFPATAVDQFNQGQPWDVVPGASIEGGHYVPIVGRLANGNLICVTWGRLQQITPRFLDQYCDEAIAYLTRERLTRSKSLEGFNHAQLKADLARLH